MKSVKVTKFQLLGSQCVKVKFDKNLMMYFQCVHSDDNKDKVFPTLLDQPPTVICEKPIKDTGALIELDGTAISASCELEIEDNEWYDTHDGNKTGSAAIGRLARSRSKVENSKFKPCKELIKEFYKVGNHFILGSNSTMRPDDAKKKHSYKTHPKYIKVNLSTALIEAFPTFFSDCQRLKLGLLHHEIEHDDVASY